MALHSHVVAAIQLVLSGGSIQGLDLKLGMETNRNRKPETPFRITVQITLCKEK